MNGTQTVEAHDQEVESLRDQVFVARNRISELLEQLESAERSYRELQDRLELSAQEQNILAGRYDGCIRLGDVRPILRRVFGEAA